MSAKDISNIGATWIGLAAAMIGGYAAFQEYGESVNKQVDDRSMAAINFVTQFQGAHMMPLREKIYGFIFCQDDCVSKMPTNSEIFAFVEFFDAVKYCSDRNLCDTAIVKDVFGPYATWHWPCLKPFVQSVRKGEEALGVSNPYGHGLERLAMKDVGPSHCGNLKS
jgi:hypothetical protein